MCFMLSMKHNLMFSAPCQDTDVQFNEKIAVISCLDFPLELKLEDRGRSEVGIHHLNVLMFRDTQL